VADKEPQEIVIIRRRANHEAEHHGGAWKIAFADFMTAMMALFLVLWLISSTSDKTKRAVAQYFNPVKLVDMTTLKKGFQDPKETETGAGPSIKETTAEPAQNRSPLWMKDVSSETAAKMPTHSESALFRDPYAVLAEIVADASAQVPTVEPEPGRAPMGAPADLAETYKDPFTTVPHVPAAKAQGAPGPQQSKPMKAADSQELQGAQEANDAEAPSRAPAPEAKSPDAKSRGRAAKGSMEPSSGEAAQARDGDAAKLRTEIFNAVRLDAPDQKLPHIDVQGTEEGVLISLTDNLTYMMFAIGSAEPQPQTIEVMAKVGRLLEAHPGSIIIRGHTDGRPYRSATYDNWRLSAARAHMAHYMLVRGGLDEKRIEKIEGYADRRLKFPKDPTAAGNRRIEILLRKDKP
jgi:chemotaxis protein MotB